MPEIGSNNNNNLVKECVVTHLNKSFNFIL